MSENKGLQSAGFVLLMGLLSAFPPLSTDMYLPALPLYQELWGVPMSMVNLTLVVFFATYCVFLLIYGPLSDRFGRRKPLLVGIAIYAMASVLCASAQSVESMIAFRILQAMGAASSSGIVLAICKDVYQGNDRERVLALLGVIIAVAPMAAPVLGSWIMAFGSWRWMFIFQAGIGIVAWIGVLRMSETLENLAKVPFHRMAASYLHVLGNVRFTALLLLFALPVIPYFAFIASSSEIYINDFGFSEQTFGYFFAFNALAVMAGAIACTKLVAYMSSGAVLSLSFLGTLLGGLAMLLGLAPGPWEFAAMMAVVSFAFGLSRAPSSNLILEQVDSHAGAASALIVFSIFMVGAVAMWAISLDWDNTIATIGLFGSICGGIALIAWLAILQPMLNRVQKA